MNTNKWIQRGLCLLCLVLQPGCQSSSSNSSGNTVATDSPGKTITIRALIDGADTIKIHGHEIWYVHESWDLPGRWQGRDEATTINGKPWRPEWNGDKSTPFEGLKPAFKPKSPAETRLTTLTGRGDVTISQMPSPDNDETLAIHLDDSQLFGAAWYEVQINWK
jgi:hypothetical protein